MRTINSFVNHLRKVESSDHFFNPYVEAFKAKNLKVYLTRLFEIPQKRVLLVGEAPGYKGCKLTGIPFSSGQVLSSFEHPFLNVIRADLKLKTNESENTATIVWQFLQEMETVPLFWNAFPFHPHPKGQLDKNRAPSKKEVVVGSQYLKAIANLYQPEVIAGIGHAGTTCAKLCFPEMDIQYIRHPSYGGKREFVEGLEDILV
ncbi:MAG: uracil-DNA glycosylase [Gammaproteobacteria bacterium]|nr:uracil-DNA glycosylase [Gammaproteobacteria bacterium]